LDPYTPAAITLTLLILAVTLGYGMTCWIWPFRSCRRCSGIGKRRSPGGRAFRYCRSCRGTGARLRAGRWLYNHLARVRRDAR
jgi:hypothetical protein